MARREVLVQLDDDLVEALDRIATERETSRSDVLRRAARTLVEVDAEAKADAELVAAYRALPQDPADDDMYLRIAIESWPEW